MPDASHDDLLATLQTRFDKHPERHKGLDWNAVRERLQAHPKKLAVLAEMENTGGEPDVIAHDGKTGELTFCDCAPESPTGRRSLCFDGAALASRNALNSAPAFHSGHSRESARRRPSAYSSAASAAMPSERHTFASKLSAAWW